MVLLALTVVVGVLTVVPGRATRLQGAVHLVLLAASCSSPSTPERSGKLLSTSVDRRLTWGFGL